MDFDASSDDVAKLLNITRQTVVDMANRGVFKDAVRTIGGRLRYNLDAVRGMLERDELGYE